MGGGRGPPMGVLMRGPPGKGGGPFTAKGTCTAKANKILQHLEQQAKAPIPGDAGTQ